ncbi:MAG: TIGR00296 family protein [Nitrososphaerota archaeon]|nr:TIGR00296 family protein [Nitrososphaerota archaeon]MDG7010708.1 TIGR00296 family protein [Nitrososphaerota archaeon]
MPLTSADGRRAVLLARDVLEAHVLGNRGESVRKLPPVFSEKRGVFVTLNKLEAGVKSLRGCIGYSEPVKPLGEAIKDVAVYASEDPRFPYPVQPDELGSIVVEVSVLTLPREVKAPSRTDLPAMVRLGVDGVVVSNRFASGLFLPQVATEQGWDHETYLSEACIKAGLPPDAWLSSGTKVEVFQAEVFGEVSPRGEVVRTGQEE